MAGVSKRRRTQTKVEEIGWPLGSLHDLRKTYGTRMARIVPMHELQRYMGHTSSETTAKYYTEPTKASEDAVRSAYQLGKTMRLAG